MPTRVRLTMLTLGVAAAMGGCKPDKCEIPTSELSMVARVIDNGVTLRAEFDFVSGERGVSADEWSSCDGDAVEINGESATETARDERVEYSTTLDATSSPRKFTFSLDRESETDVIAEVELAPAFEVTSPEAGALLSRASETRLSWAPAARVDTSEMRIGLVEEIGEGFCIVSDDPEHDYKSAAGVTVVDIGEWVIPASALSSESDASCDARFVLSRFTAGEYPAVLKPGGFVEGEVLRNAVFVSEP